jgi:dTDP-4-dehydrorhamnose 3,5-epimerase
VIEGVRVSERRQIIDDRGKIVHMLRCDDDEYLGFGEVYFSWVNPGKVKAWHLHSRMALNYTCPVGAVRLALYDTRSASPTLGELMEVEMSADAHRLVQVPPGVWNGFVGLRDYPSMVCNCATLPHDPDEITRRDPDDPEFPYAWPVPH